MAPKVGIMTLKPQPGKTRMVAAMTDQQIINALRICAAHPGGDCRKCPYFTRTGCFRKILLDAADRLEELCKR